MKILHPFVIHILNKLDTHPLQAASNHSGEKMVEMGMGMELGAGASYSPNKRESVVALNDLVLPARDSYHYLQLPEFLQIRKGARSELIRNTRNTLWLRVGWREKRANAQFCRQFQLALPTDISVDAARQAMTTFAEKSLVSEGMIADLAIHELREVNGLTNAEEVTSRTGHLMCTTRPFEQGKFINKDRQWNDRTQLLLWRKSWFESLLPHLPAEDSEGLSQSSKDLWKFAKRFAKSSTTPRPHLAQAADQEPEVEANPQTHQDGAPIEAPIPRRTRL